MPREPRVRQLMAHTGVDLSIYGPSSEEDLEAAQGEGEDEAYEGQEAWEEEEHVDDPCS